MTRIDFFSKVGDAAQMIADACNEELESRNPDQTEQNYNPETIVWVRTEGTKGIYERYPENGKIPENTADYNGLLADLKAHNEKMNRAGLFYWLFSDKFTIGRKPAKK